MPTYLPDINVLLALTFEAHQHHAVAAEWIERGSDCRVCRVTQSGFLRLATNPALFGDESLTLSQAWNVYDTMMEDDRFSFWSEPLGLEHLWRRLTNVQSYSPKVWMDRYLAAFAIADSLTLVTLDGAFSSVSGLSVEVLTG
ncbi:MAG: TA system VapC family ribonuclease toxin [Alkalispirochaeta sp.]